MTKPKNKLNNLRFLAFMSVFLGTYIIGSAISNLLYSQPDATFNQIFAAIVALYFLIETKK